MRSSFMIFVKFIKVFTRIMIKFHHVYKILIKCFSRFSKDSLGKFLMISQQLPKSNPEVFLQISRFFTDSSNFLQNIPEIRY